MKYIPGLLGWLGKLLPDLLGLVGLTTLTVGIWLIWYPLALIVLGILLILTGYRIEYNARNHVPPGKTPSDSGQ